MAERLTDDFDTIEKYFDGKLGKKERSEFEERLLAEPRLKTQYDCYAALVEGIREARRQELHQYIHEQTEQVRAGKTFFFGLLPFVLTAALILGAVYFLTESYIPRQYKIPAVIGRVDSLIRLPIKAIRETNSDELKQELEPQKTIAEETGGVLPDETETGNADEATNGDYTVPADAENFTLKEEHLLFDTTLTQLHFYTQTGDSLAADSAVAGTPLRVEFWESPINYKGYKHTGRKLILYGIDAPYQVRLLAADDDLYLLHEKRYFYIEKDGEFHTYKPMEPGLVKKLLNR